MANVVKEMAKRITLVDLIQDAKEAHEFNKKIDDQKLKPVLTGNLVVRSLNRGLIRIIGDISAAMLGYAASLDTEQLPRYGAAAVGAFTAAYLLDHLIYDRFNPGYWKKNEPK